MKNHPELPLDDEVVRKQLHTKLTAAFADEFQKQFGQRYSHSGGPDGSAMKRFLVGLKNDVTEEQFRKALTFAWTQQKDKFLNELTSISGFLFHWNRVSRVMSMSESNSRATHSGKW